MPTSRLIDERLSVMDTSTIEKVSFSGVTVEDSDLCERVGNIIDGRSTNTALKLDEMCFNRV